MGPKRNARVNVDPTKGTKGEEDETKKRRTTEATASGDKPGHAPETALGGTSMIANHGEMEAADLATSKVAREQQEHETLLAANNEAAANKAGREAEAPLAGTDTNATQPMPDVAPEDSNEDPEDTAEEDEEGEEETLGYQEKYNRFMDAGDLLIANMEENLRDLASLCPPADGTSEWNPMAAFIETTERMLKILTEELDSTEIRAAKWIPRDADGLAGTEDPLRGPSRDTSPERPSTPKRPTPRDDGNTIHHSDVAKEMDLRAKTVLEVGDPIPEICNQDPMGPYWWNLPGPEPDWYASDKSEVHWPTRVKVGPQHCLMAVMHRKVFYNRMKTEMLTICSTCNVARAYTMYVDDIVATVPVEPANGKEEPERDSQREQQGHNQQQQQQCRPRGRLDRRSQK